MNDRTREDPRALALDLLVKAERSNQFSNIALDKALESSRLEDVDRRLASALFYGVIEKRISLDYRISDLSSRAISDIDTLTLNALRMGLYQLIYMDRIPPHAAINETVGLCPRRSSGFVNGILRAHTRREPTPLPSKTDNAVRYMSVAYSVCEELCRKLITVYGVERCESILDAFSRIPVTTLRVNTLRVSRNELMERLNGASATELSPNGIRVTGALRDLYGFDEGLFFVQDEASQLCVEVLNAKENETVMDICACPGSKSFGAAIDMKNRGRVLSFDLHKSKLSLVTESAKRLGIDIIDAALQDGRIPLPHMIDKADKVICDVPCSGFGVLSKKPELRYKDPALSASLPDIQLAILENACNYVKHGGVLVYSTCTILPEENEENIFRFLDKHKEFSLVPFNAGTLKADKGYLTLLPDRYPTDGFFIAKLIRS